MDGRAFASGRTASANRHASGARWVLAIALVVIAAPAGAWVTRIGGMAGIDDAVRSIARDRGGNLLSVSATGIVAYDGASGGVRWQERFEPANVAPVYTIAVDAHGDAVVLEDRCCPTTGGGWSVTKRSGATGRVLWRYAGPATFWSPAGPFLDPTGEVLVAVGVPRSAGNVRDLAAGWSPRARSRPTTPTSTSRSHRSRPPPAATAAASRAVAAAGNRS